MISTMLSGTGCQNETIRRSVLSCQRWYLYVISEKFQFIWCGIFSHSLCPTTVYACV